MCKHKFSNKKEDYKRKGKFKITKSQIQTDYPKLHRNKFLFYSDSALSEDENQSEKVEIKKQNSYDYDYLELYNKEKYRILVNKGEIKPKIAIYKYITETPMKQFILDNFILKNKDRWRFKLNAYDIDCKKETCHYMKNEKIHVLKVGNKLIKLNNLKGTNLFHKLQFDC